MSKKRLRSSPIRGLNATDVDVDSNVIKNVAVVTTGEAIGHNVHLDQEFIANVATLGNEKQHGVKARFGHPAMSSDALGTFIGRFKSFRVDGDITRADLHLSTTAGKNNPNGDLKQYVIDMAKNEPDMFGTSIVFIPGETYKRSDDGRKIHKKHGDDDESREYRDTDGPEYVEIHSISAADVVDEPAANDGFFSTFSKSTFAGKATEFLDEHPEIYDLLIENPDIVDPFLSRYQKIKENIMTKDIIKTPTQTTTDAKGTPKEMIEEFGAVFAAEAIIDGLDIETARRSYYQNIRQENESLNSRIDELKSEIDKLKHELSEFNVLEEPIDAQPTDDDNSEFNSRSRFYSKKLGDKIGSFAAGIKIPTK